MLPLTGNLPLVEGTIYTVYTMEGTEVAWLQCVNGGAGSATVQFFLTVNGVKASLTPPIVIEVGTVLDVLENKPPLKLGRNAVVSGVSSIASVSYVIAGVEL